jgi:hypothetical protein
LVFTNTRQRFLENANTGNILRARRDIKGNALKLDGAITHDDQDCQETSCMYTAILSLVCEKELMLPEING